jgi:hypothetical protein
MENEAAEGLAASVWIRNPDGPNAAIAANGPYLMSELR